MPVDETRTKKKQGEAKWRSSLPNLSQIFHPATRPVIGQPSQEKPHCKVFLLDGQYHIIPVDRKAKGKVVISELFRYLELKDLQEREYFSVYYVDLSGSKIFLNPFKQIRKQIPNASSRSTWDLFFGVQFYATKLSMLTDEMTRYLFVLQMCRDIKEKRIHADRLTKLQLVSLLVQANCGDYDPKQHKPGYVDTYIDMIYNPAEIPVGMATSVNEVHKEKTGFRPSEADNAFFMITKSLYRYGQQIFPVHDRLGQSGQVGASIVGLFFHKDGKQFMNIPWEDVVTVSYRKKKLRIKYYPKGSSENIEHLLFLYCSEPSAKVVWRGCVEQHAFFRLERPAPLVQNTVKSYHSFNRNSELRFSRGRTLYQMLRSENKQKPEFQRSLPTLYPIENTDKDPEPRPTIKSLNVATPSPVTEPEPSRPEDNKFYMTVEITKSESDLTRVVEFSTSEKQNSSFTVTFKERTPSPAMMSHADGMLDPATQGIYGNCDEKDGTVTAIACDIELQSPSPTYDEKLIEEIKIWIDHEDHQKIYDPDTSDDHDDETYDYEICGDHDVDFDRKSHDDHDTPVDYDILDDHKSHDIQKLYIDHDNDDRVDDKIHKTHDAHAADDKTCVGHEETCDDHEETHDDPKETHVDCEETSYHNEEVHVDHEETLYDHEEIHVDHEETCDDDKETHVDHEEAHDDHEISKAIPLLNVEDSKITEDVNDQETMSVMEIFPILQKKKDLEHWGKIMLFYMNFLTFYLILFLLTRVSSLYD